jgi:phosphoribosylformimino-5-aminoimidazole carboxamide ribotide isomerase
MRIYPAIDIKNGKCVRLMQGDFDKLTVFSDSPKDIALKWQSENGEFLHLVDLDGALKGSTVNFETIKEIMRSIDIPVQIGGGIRDIETIEKYLNIGVNRVIIGTKAVSNIDFVEEIVKKYNEKIVIGIDAKDSKVAVEGWEKVSDFTPVEFAKRMEHIGVKTIVYTDISRDGMLKGVNIEAMKEMVNNVNINIIASGGVTSIEDIIKLKEVNIEGAIIGKALYTGDISLREALNKA